MKEQTVSNTTPRAVVDASSNLGIDKKRLFSKIELSESYIMQPDGRTSFKDVFGYGRNPTNSPGIE